MTVNEFLQQYRRVEFGLNVTRPRIRCADGFTISVQAGYGMRSLPARDADYYLAVELGYPSEADDALAEFAEDADALMDTVYNFMPAETVDAMLAKYGGIVGADFGNDHSGKWSDMRGGAAG